MSQALYDRMLALADQLHSRGFVSDLIHFGLDDPEVSVLPSRRLGVSRDTAYIAGREAYLQQFTRGEVARSVDRFPRLWRGDEPADSVPDVSDYDVALEAELGLTFTQMRDLYGAVLSAGYARDGAVTVTRVSDLVDELEATLGWPREDVERGFDLLALRPRAQFAPPGSPFRTEDVYPWRFNRTLSYLRRPLAVRPGSNGEEVVWGDRHLYVAILYFGDLVINGYLKAESSEMRSLIGRLRDEDGHEFTKQVSELFEAQERFIVRREVKKIGGVRIERRRGEDLGDVDVFVAEPGVRRLRAIEAKDLAVARTPAELSNELAATFKSTATHQAAIDRHVERVEWLRERIPDVLAWLGLEDDPDQWSVDGLMVLDIELMSPYLVDPPLPVITYRELRDELDRV
jgi:hypothetical protein